METESTSTAPILTVEPVEPLPIGIFEAPTTTPETIATSTDPIVSPDPILVEPIVSIDDVATTTDQTNLSLENPTPDAAPTASDIATYYIDKYYEKIWNGSSKNHYFLGTISLATDNLSGSTAGIFYTLGDHLGSSSLITNSYGNMTERTEYYPYGSIAATASNLDIGDHYKYTGKELDSETNLSYYGARYYNQNIGKFMAIDPAIMVIHDSRELKRITQQNIHDWLSNPQNLNGYSYAGNNPIIYTDPTGQSIVGDFGRDTAAGQRKIASFMNQIGGYYSSHGDMPTGFVINLAADTVYNIANIYDPDQKPVTRVLSLALTAIDASSFGEDKVAIKAGETGGSLFSKLIKSEISIGPTTEEFLKPIYSTELLGKSKALIDESTTVIVKYRNSLGSDGALSRIVKTFDLQGKIVSVSHQVIDVAGKIIHSHLK